MSLTRDQKLQQIQSEAERLDRLLHSEFQHDPTYMAQMNGGHLFAGRCYAESDKVFLSLNPGKYDGVAPFDTDLDSIDWYWGNLTSNTISERQLRRYPLLWHTNRFFSCDQALEQWMAASRFTSAPLIPWRTPDAVSLQASPKLEAKVLSYSKKILRLMFEHCQPRVVIVLGKQTLEHLAEYLDIVVPWMGETELGMIGQPGCRDDGWVMLARQDLALESGQISSYSIWKKPRGRKYLVCRNGTNDRGDEILWTDDCSLAQRVLAQVSSGAMRQEFQWKTCDRTRLYRWGYFQCVADSRTIDIYLLPFFARATDTTEMQRCATWLGGKLVP